LGNIFFKTPRLFFKFPFPTDSRELRDMNDVHKQEYKKWENIRLQAFQRSMKFVIFGLIDAMVLCNDEMLRIYELEQQDIACKNAEEIKKEEGDEDESNPEDDEEDIPLPTP
jgi:hypothetical protein